VRISFYGRLADAFGRELQLDVAAPSSVGEIRSRLKASRPQEDLGDTRMRACVNGVMVSDSHILREGDALEFLAPVSGG
jgi:molybdopterin converting factor small subunit